jgi:hypothetical protein
MATHTTPATTRKANPGDDLRPIKRTPYTSQQSRWLLAATGAIIDVITLRIRFQRTAPGAIYRCGTPLSNAPRSRNVTEHPVVLHVFLFRRGRETGVSTMPATSKAQQKAAGAALAAKRGEIKKSELQGASREMYESMTEDQLEDFAETKRKGLPEKKSD